MLLFKTCSFNLSREWSYNKLRSFTRADHKYVISLYFLFVFNVFTNSQSDYYLFNFQISNPSGILSRWRRKIHSNDQLMLNTIFVHGYCMLRFKNNNWKVIQTCLKGLLMIMRGQTSWLMLGIYSFLTCLTLK